MNEQDLRFLVCLCKDIQKQEQLFFKLLDGIGTTVDQFLNIHAYPAHEFPWSSRLRVEDDNNPALLLPSLRNGPRQKGLPRRLISEDFNDAPQRDSAAKHQVQRMNPSSNPFD